MPLSSRRLVVLVLATLALAVSVPPDPDEVVGSVHRDVYHRPDCHNARQIHEENLERWPTAEAASEAGYRPGQHCFPDAWARWNAARLEAP